MRLIATRSLKNGDELDKPVYNERGDILIQRGIPLTQRMIDRLMMLGISYVYVRDPFTEDVEIVTSVTEKTRRKALKTIKLTFEDFHIDQFKNTFQFDNMAGDFTSVVRSILGDLRKNSHAVNLLSEVISYDRYVFTHSLNVTVYSLALGMELKYPQRKLEEIGLGAMLHDIGKMFVPLDILQKPGKLLPEEFDIVKKHSFDGFQLLRNAANIPLVAAHCAFQHHERLNGSGYPRGISGTEIHEYGRVIAVADVFDAVTSNRVYRSAMLPHEGLELLFSGANRLFDQKMVEAFHKAIVLYPNGLTVSLSDGRTGIVVKQNPGVNERPVIRILEEAGVPLMAPYEEDLSLNLSCMITACDTTLAGNLNRFAQAER